MCRNLFTNSKLKLKHLYVRFLLIVSMFITRLSHCKSTAYASLIKAIFDEWTTYFDKCYLALK